MHSDNKILLESVVTGHFGFGHFNRCNFNRGDSDYLIFHRFNYRSIKKTQLLSVIETNFPQTHSKISNLTRRISQFCETAIIPTIMVICHILQPVLFAIIQKINPFSITVRVRLRCSKLHFQFIRSNRGRKIAVQNGDSYYQEHINLKCINWRCIKLYKLKSTAILKTKNENVIETKELIIMIAT